MATLTRDNRGKFTSQRSALSIVLDDRSLRFIDRVTIATTRTRVLDRIEKVFDRNAALAAGYVSRELLAGQRLKRRTGVLARSVIGRAVRVRGLPTMQIGVLQGPALKYARIHEHGGIIRPRKAKALAQPIGAALTPAGVARYSGPRAFPGKLFRIPVHRGKVVGLLIDAATGKAVFRLLSEVEIKGQHYLRDGMLRQLPRAADDVRAVLRDALRGR